MHFATKFVMIFTLVLFDPYLYLLSSFIFFDLYIHISTLDMCLYLSAYICTFWPFFCLVDLFVLFDLCLYLLTNLYFLTNRYLYLSTRFYMFTSLQFGWLMCFTTSYIFLSISFPICILVFFYILQLDFKDNNFVWILAYSYLLT